MDIVEGLEFDRMGGDARSNRLASVAIAVAALSEGINGGGNSGD